MMASSLLNIFSKCLSVVLVIIYLFFSTVPVSAVGIGGETRQLHEWGLNWFDPECTLSSSAPSVNNESSIYVIGDSLTVGMKDTGDLEAKLEEKSYIIEGIQAEEGAFVEDAIVALTFDTGAIVKSDTMVIALGTNKDSDFSDKVTELITLIKGTEEDEGINPDINIKWVNVAADINDAEDTNETILNKSAELGFSVIDWAAEYSENPDIYPAADDGIHHTAEGYETRARWIVDQIGESTPTEANSINQTGCVCGQSDYGSAAGVPISGENPERMFKFFVDRGLTAEQAAGITGNAMAESTPNIDPGAANGTSYRGIFQWDTGGRWAGLENWASGNASLPGSDPNSAYTDPGKFETQLAYSWEEASARATEQGTPRSNIDGIKAQPDVEHATWYWGRFFEVAIISGSTSVTPLTNVQKLDERTQYAEQVLAQYGSYAPSAGGGEDGGGPAVVALDPGHGGQVPDYVDEVTGLGDRETTNSPEREDVLDVSLRTKQKLETAGFEVEMLRTSNDQAISKRERIEAAKAASASIGVSIHTYSGQSFESWGEVWPQFVGGYRENDDTKVTFENQEVADLSSQYADAFVTARNEAEHDGEEIVEKVVGQPGSFGQDRPGLLSFGDLSLIQLWADTIPWVYNEVGAPAAGLTDEQKEKYAEGIAQGVVAANPGPGAFPDSDCGGSETGSISSTVLKYAWPDYRAPPAPEKKPEYERLVAESQTAGIYVGGGSEPGVDCGGWVTALMLQSGHEPDYNFSGKTSDGASNVAGGQSPWLEENWERIGPVSNTSELQPGDVAINQGKSHTFAFVGDIDGFESDIASASYSTSGQGWRAPMAGRENPLASNIIWYRKR